MTNSTTPAPTDTPLNEAAPEQSMPVAPLFSFWPCVVATIIVVTVLFTAPWSEVGTVLIAVLESIVAAIEALGTYLLALGKIGIAALLMIFMSCTCILIKAAAKEQNVQYEAWIGLSALMSLVLLSVIFISHVINTRPALNEAHVNEFNEARVNAMASIEATENGNLAKAQAIKASLQAEIEKSAAQ